jgi:hypothetical protein
MVQIQNLINGLLQRGYVGVARQTIEAIARGSTTGIIAQRLQELEDEAARLDAEGLRLTPDNPIVRALMADLEPVLRRDATLIDAVAPDVQQNGVSVASETGAVGSTGFTAEQLNRLGIQWIQPNPETLNRVIGYASSEAFQNSLENYQQGIMDAIIRGIVSGAGPRATARLVRQQVEDLPVAYANSMLRTLQVTASRDATNANRVANADILTVQIRISALQKGRTCMACVALHGTEMPIGARVDDHNNGLCTSVAVVRGAPAPQISTGDEFFNSLSKSEKEEWMASSASVAAFRAFDAGKIQLRDFVGSYEHEVYGNQVVPKSLKGMLGADDAKTFYSINQNDK